jgi:hypothetical protein
MADKNKELNTTVRLVNNKLHFHGTTGNQEPVSIDYIAPMGDDLGYTSLELFLMSLSSCVGSAMLVFLRRMNKTILILKLMPGELEKRNIRRVSGVFILLYMFSRLISLWPNSQRCHPWQRKNTARCGR